MIDRRSLLIGTIASAFAAPAIVRASNLMPVHSIEWTDDAIARELMRRLNEWQTPFGIYPPERVVKIYPDLNETKYIRYGGYQVLDLKAGVAIEPGAHYYDGTFKMPLRVGT